MTVSGEGRGKVWRSLREDPRAEDKVETETHPLPATIIAPFSTTAFCHPHFSSHPGSHFPSSVGIVSFIHLRKLDSIEHGVVDTAAAAAAAGKTRGPLASGPSDERLLPPPSQDESWAALAVDWLSSSYATAPSTTLAVAVVVLLCFWSMWRDYWDSRARQMHAEWLAHREALMTLPKRGYTMEQVLQHDGTDPDGPILMAFDGDGARSPALRWRQLKAHIARAEFLRRVR